MRYGFYDPYLETLGGGEKYILTMMEVAIQAGGDVYLLSPTEPDPDQWKRFDISIKKSDFTWQRADDSSIPELSHGYDVFTVMHSGLPPACYAKRSLAHIQFPFEPLPFKRKRDFLNPFGSYAKRQAAKQALSTYDRFIVNSEFTKRHTVSRLGVKPGSIDIIHPPVDVPTQKPKRKEPIILAVGRFITHGHHKKQDLMVDAFRALHEQLGTGSDWSLHLVGGADGSPETKRFIKTLEQSAEGLPVTFHVNAPYKELVDLYRRASVFWHAAGADEDAAKYPERLEHFGITTAEAMMYQAVPVVIGRGGQTEIVEDGRTGYLWQSPEELIERTHELVDQPKRRAIMGKDAAKAARRFSKEEFVKRVRKELLS